MKKTKEMQIATINKVAIVVTDDSEKLIPIRPICEALGVAYQSQISKLKEDDFLSSTVTLSVTVGADGREREMVCLPYEYIFGWLFTINPKNVKPEAQETVAKFRIECYNALFAHFAEPKIFLAQQKETSDAIMVLYQEARVNFRDAKKIMESYYSEFNKVRKLTIEQWRENNRQFELPFEILAQIGGTNGN